MLGKIGLKSGPLKQRIEGLNARTPGAGKLSITELLHVARLDDAVSLIEFRSDQADTSQYTMLSKSPAKLFDMVYPVQRRKYHRVRPHGGRKLLQGALH
jgi:hypothetical protein